MSLWKYANQKSKTKSCELCTSEDTVDYHHWDYDTDEGCYLCRDCHDKIHENGARPKESKKWFQDAIHRVVEIHVQQGKTENPDVVMEAYSIPEKYRIFVIDALPKRSVRKYETRDMIEECAEFTNGESEKGTLRSSSK